MNLPVKGELRHCVYDNFLFLSGGCQRDYDEFYAAFANDTCHREVSAGAARSPISQVQCEHLVAALPDFFTVPRNVLDFGCGEGSLLVELASSFDLSNFVGFEPGPAAQLAASKAKVLHLKNMSMRDRESAIWAKYDLVIISHVLEHLIDFDVVGSLGELLAPDGLLYVEVPNAYDYPEQERLEFLYYFDRLHVNHFTPQSLTRLMAGYGLGIVRHFTYSFPYRDGGTYPALGAIFRKAKNGADIPSPDLLARIKLYLQQEREKATRLGRDLASFDGILVWGAGDNFYRSIGNDGPLANLRNFVVLDRRPGVVEAGKGPVQTMDPETAIRKFAWPVVVTVSEDRAAIAQQISLIAPTRRVIFI